MPTFPSVTPAYGATKNSNPTVIAVDLGDGYQQRLTYGLNQDAKTWNLNWQNITEADAELIEDFLEARKGQEAFTWTPPDGPSGDLSKRWICDAWAKTMTYSGRYSISASFRQVFET